MPQRLQSRSLSAAFSLYRSNLRQLLVKQELSVQPNPVQTLPREGGPADTICDRQGHSLGAGAGNADLSCFGWVAGVSDVDLKSVVEVPV